eukprot:TRINITY_DN12309_c0_g2_i2.p1 TRINITY_DN12309_c0_g2~~TRINITY_DN12309_c0_g2_i2.p1  ORF type:complete len:148 (+),score=27.51 TRINITY_DN12309_c0_g2_i2:241-684(+)
MNAVAAFKQTDVSNDSELAELFAFADETYGRVDVVFNNAGVEGGWTTLDDKAAVEHYDFLYNVNVRPVIASFQHAVPLLVKSGGGIIINTSSVVSTLYGPKIGVYASSKSAVDGITRVAAVELAEKNIKGRYTLECRILESMGLSLQ